jgi:hypothetical protein
LRIDHDQTVSILTVRCRDDRDGGRPAKVLTTRVLVAQAKRAGTVEVLVAPDEAPRGP